MATKKQIMKPLTKSFESTPEQDEALDNLEKEEGAKAPLQASKRKSPAQKKKPGRKAKFDNPVRKTVILESNMADRLTVAAKQFGSESNILTLALDEWLASHEF